MFDGTENCHRLSQSKDDAIAQGEEVYNRYDRYLSGGAKLFHEGYLDCAQYTLEKYRA